jgi:PAS domain-containing protein
MAEVQDGEVWISVHPDDIEASNREWRSCLAAGTPFQREQRFRRADGVYRWHLVRRVPRRNDEGDLVNWYGVAFDIEEQKRAEDALRRSEAYLAKAERELRLTIDWIPTLAWHTRPDGYAEYLNRRWLDYTGLTLEEGSKRACVVSTAYTAGFCFAPSHSAMKREILSDGTGRIPTSRTGSRPKVPCSGAKPIWRKRNG